MKYLLTLTMIVAYFISHSQNWTGAVSSDWSNSANWSAPPMNGAAVTIDPANYTGGGHHPTISSNSTFTVSTMQVVNGAVLTIGANLTTTSNVGVANADSEIIVNAGTFSVNFTGNGRLTADLGGKITVNGGNIKIGQRLISGQDALIVINGGAVTTNQRLLMDLGGKIILNNGVVNVGTLMALADGSAVNSSYFEQNGGTITITGETSLECETGDFEPTILINGGTFTLNGDLTWFGDAPGSGKPVFRSTGGLININGNITNLPLSTVNVHLVIESNSQFNFNGTTIDLIYSADLVEQKGNSTFNLAGNTVWNHEGVFNAFDGVTSFNGPINFSGSGVVNIYNNTSAY